MRVRTPRASDLEIHEGHDGSVHIVLLSSTGRPMAGIQLTCESACAFANIVGELVDDYLDAFEAAGGDTIGDCAGSA